MKRLIALVVLFFPLLSFTETPAAAPIISD